MGRQRACRCSTRVITLILTAVLMLSPTGCPSVSGVLESDFQSLDDLRGSGEAVARVYVAPIPLLPSDHTWFVVKRAEVQEFTRWEMFVYRGGIHGYVFQDLLPPEADLGSGGVRILAEVQGPEADALIDCIERAAATYPCRNTYLLFPGPNSNGFAQWTLNQCGWNVPLPASVVGKNVPCPATQ